MIVCGQDYDANNIVGINPVSSASFTACVDLCMYQGTECAGVSYFADQSNCFLKTKMFPSANHGSGDTFYGQILGVADGVRTMYGSGTIQQGGISDLVINAQCSGTSDGMVSLDNVFFYVFLTTGDSNPPCSTGASILQNGGFDTAFPPWTTSQGSSTSASFSVSGGQANVQYVAGASTDDNPALISQSASIPADTSYKVTADLYLTISSQGSCAVNFANEFETLYTTGQITTSQRLPVDFDGISDIASSSFAISISCSGPGVNRVGIDSVGLVVNSGQECSP